MKYRQFRHLGPVSEIGYGMWGMGGWSGSDDAESLRSLHRAVELGCTFFDTAWAYGQGHSERLLGTLVRAHPDRRWQPENVLKALDTGLVDAVQVVYNVFDQAPEDVLFPACRARGVAVIARVPFDEGTLTGTLTRDSRWPDGDWRNTYFSPENLAASVDRATALVPLVPAGSTMPDLALRFILACPDVATVIPGMRKTRHVEANLAVSDRGPLPADLVQALRAHRWDRAVQHAP
jgi:aryl-alcohol dehydrogenase-like predicted oxidoreductase